MWNEVDNMLNNERLAVQSAAFSYIDAHRDEMLELLKELVRMESGSYDVEDVDRVVARVAEELKNDGLDVGVAEYEQAGNTLVAGWNRDGSKKPIVFIGHLDTVFEKGSLAKMPLRIEDGKGFGPGFLDMKGGAVIAIYVLRALGAAGYGGRPVKIILSGDEETGHEMSGSQKLIMDECRGAAAAFVFETGYADNKIIIKRKGAGRFVIENFGLSAHAGICPENGRHAILDMAHKIIAVQALNQNPDGTTYNVGTITGGTVPNAVPDCCRVAIDIRYQKQEHIAGILENLERVANTAYVDGVTSKLTGGMSFLPMEDNEGNRALFEIVKEAAVSLGQPTPYPGATGGGSDAAYPSAAGVPTVCSMGIQGALSHTPNEYGVIETLYDRAKLMITTLLLAEEKQFI